MESALGSTEAVEAVETTEAVETVETTEAVESNWYDSIEDEGYKETASKFENPSDMVKELTNAQGLIGKKGIIRPDEDATESDWDQYHKDLGVPESANEYDLGITEDTAEWAKEFEGTFSQFAKDNNMSMDQAKGAFGQYVEMQNTAMQELEVEAQQQYDECMAELKDNFGDDSDRMLGLAGSMASEYGFIDNLKNSGVLGSNPQLITALADLAKLKGKASAVKIDSDITNISKTIDQRISDLEHSEMAGTDTDEGRKIQADIFKLITKKHS